MIRLILATLIAILGAPLWAEDKEGGIIGTGVVGEVTGVDAFEVSGMRFNLPEDVELKGIDSVDDLRMGMTLALSTQRDDSGWRATQLRRIPVLIGPVTGAGEVMGVRVTGDLPAEGAVIVDGYWSDDGVVATRITPVARGLDQITGRFDPAGRIGAVPVRGAVSQSGADEIVIAAGRYEDDVLNVETLDPGLFMGLVPDLLLAEGFIGKADSSGEAKLYSADVKVAVDEQSIASGQKIRRCALRGRLDYDLSELSPEDAKMIRDFCVSEIQ